MTTLAQSILTRLVADPRGCLTIAEMMFDGYADTDHKLHNVLELLLRRVFIVRTHRGCYEASVDGRNWVAAGREMVLGGGHLHKRTRGIPAAAWAWLRIHRKGRIEDMLSSIATAATPGAEATLRRYLNALEAAAYVQRICRGGGFSRYLLVSDTGRHAPVHRRDKGVVYDPNLGSEIALNPDREGSHD